MLKGYMSKEKRSRKKGDKPGSGKQERYIQPSILLGLKLRSSYGYEIIRQIQDFGFVEGEAPPGMIYRHLRQLESDALVFSEWITEDSGPAKRMYSLTPEGEAFLALWIEYMQRQADKIEKFINQYRAFT